jgi:hypothetical protein
MVLLTCSRTLFQKNWAVFYKCKRGERRRVKRRLIIMRTLRTFLPFHSYLRATTIYPILARRITRNTLGFIMEFNAAIWSPSYSMDSMKCKLLLHNVHCYCFEPCITYQIVATVIVSGSSHVLHLLMNPQFVQLLPVFSDLVRETEFTKQGEKFLIPFIWRYYLSVSHTVYTIYPVH